MNDPIYSFVTEYGVHGVLETAREGFPGMDGAQFVSMFCRHMKCDPGDTVTRIEFEYVDQVSP